MKAVISGNIGCPHLANNHRLIMDVFFRWFLGHGSGAGSEWRTGQREDAFVRMSVNDEDCGGKNDTT